MIRNGTFWTIGEHLYIFNYSIISYQMINVYRCETNNIGRFLWNNGVRGNETPISTTVLIVRDKMLW